MKTLITHVLLLFLVACASSKLYIDAVDPNATVINVAPLRIVEKEVHKPVILIYIDGYLVIPKEDEISFTVESFRISPDPHKLNLAITAYSGTRAKYKELEIEFTVLESEIYNLIINIPEEFEGDIKADSYADVSLSNTDNTIYDEKVVLADNWGRSIPGVVIY